MPKTIAGVMHEWGQGKLHSGSKTGPVVKSQKQAVAIALNSGTDAPKAKPIGAPKMSMPHPHRNLGKFLHKSK